MPSTTVTVPGSRAVAGGADRAVRGEAGIVEAVLPTGGRCHRAARRAGADGTTRYSARPPSRPWPAPRAGEMTGQKRSSPCWHRGTDTAAPLGVHDDRLAELEARTGPRPATRPSPQASCPSVKGDAAVWEIITSEWQRPAPAMRNQDLARAGLGHRHVLDRHPGPCAHSNCPHPTPHHFPVDRRLSTAGGTPRVVGQPPAAFCPNATLGAQRLPRVAGRRRGRRGGAARGSDRPRLMRRVGPLGQRLAVAAVQRRQALGEPRVAGGASSIPTTVGSPSRDSPTAAGRSSWPRPWVTSLPSRDWSSTL